MSTKYPYIDVAVNIAEGAQPAVDFLTEGAPAVQLPALSGLASHFTGLDEGYLMWPAGNKRAYTFFMLDGLAGQPIMTITLLVDRDAILSGRSVINLISAIKGRVTEGEALTTESVDRMASEAGFVEEPLRSEFDAWGTPATGGVCCRTYASAGELTNIIGFPRQEAYNRYRGVVVVPSSVLMVSGEELPQITSPVDKALLVICPEGVTASAESVNFSDHLKVTYSSQGFDPVSVMFEVGTTNRYVRINGPALIVNNALHAGIVFRRRVPYTVVSLGGSPINTYTILINDRTASRTDEGFEVSNTDFEDGKVKITVSSTNYSTYSQTFTPEMLEESIPLAIVLEPESRDILLRLDFGEGRVIEDRVNIEKNTPEYNQLRAGRFHGFRAHRLMGSSPETYNIDVKPTYDATPSARTRAEATLPFDEPVSEPVRTAAPAEVKAEAPATPVKAPVESPAPEAKKPAAAVSNGPVAPEFQKAPTAIWEDEKPEIKAPEFANVTKGEEKERTIEIDYKKYGKYAAIAVVALLVLWGIIKMFSSCGGSHDDNLGNELTGDSATMVTTTDGGQVVDAAQAVTTPTADEQADIDYLNDNKVWKEDRLRSDKYKALYGAFVAGSIDEIVNNDYFAVESRCKNSEALKAVDMMWKAKGTGQAKSHRRLMTKAADKGSLDIHSLYEEVAKRMPKAEEYNTEARPSRK
ncbi:MAG: hypothetical protein NC111_06870 [Bacteroides sp.]|nr:hypothetical protein [Bacteroides sp.]MCM1413753.1 hypothetical protein [Bacteroides sp.]MCM1472228.1 hypothetical protein [Bacteroides sp.]